MTVTSSEFTNKDAHVAHDMMASCLSITDKGIDERAQYCIG